MRYPLMLGLVFCVLGFGCLLQPYSEDVNYTKKTGCQYNEPPCGENYSCINNTCVLKQGCAYDNPPCADNETCQDNACILKTGCAYSNPPCKADYDCIDNTCKENTICGKFGCQAGEMDSCCQDCGCDQGYICDDSGICLKNGSEISLGELKIQSLPSTVLHTVHPKKVEAKLGPLVQLSLNHTGTDTAYMVKLKSEVQGYSGKVVYELGTMASKESLEYNITQLLDDHVLELENASQTKINIELEYREFGQVRTVKKSAMLQLTDRNAFDWGMPEAAAAWVDPSDQSIIIFSNDAITKKDAQIDVEIERSARQVYNHLQAFGMKHDGGSPCYSDSMAFPGETLANKSGDCAELSVLYASLLEAGGLKSAIIKTDGIVLSGFVKADGTLVPLDLRNIGSADFGNATASGASEYAKGGQVVFPQTEWYGGTGRVNLGIELLSPSISTTSANCVLLPEEFNVNYWFENKGFENGRRCLKAVLYDGQSEYFSQRTCVDVPKLQKRNVTISIKVPKGHAFSEKCWID